MFALARTVRRHPVSSVVTATLLTRAAMLLYFLRVRPDILSWRINECGMIAASLVRGHGFAGGFHDFSGPTTWFAPVYPVILSGLFRMFGIQTLASAIAVCGVHILCAMATAVLIMNIGARLCNPTAGLIGALIWGLTPKAALPEFLLVESTVSAMLVCLGILLALGLSAKSRKWQWFLSGMVWGFAGLTSPATLAALPVILIYLSRKIRPLPWTPALVLTAAVGVTLAPWMIRDAMIFHRFVPVRDNGLAEIYFANVGYEENPSGGSMEYQRLGEAKFVTMIEKKLVSYLRSHPLRFVKDSLVRVTRFWTNPDGLFGISGLVSVLSFVGLLVVLQRCWLAALPFFAVMCAYPLIYYMSVTFSRYRQPVDPFLYVLAAYAVIEAVAWMKKKSALAVPAETEQFSARSN